MSGSTHRFGKREAPFDTGTVLRGPSCPEAPKGTPGLRPPLKWPGGKRWLLPHLGQIWRGYCCRRLVEPFAGGMAITLGLRPSRALLNDINPHLINFYRWVQQGFTIDFLMWNSRAHYELARARFNRLIIQKTDNRDEAAALFYYLNRTGYNGLCRFNRRGMFNVPFGRHEHITYASDFSQYRAALEGWTFLAGDFEDMAVDPDDFIYADPPYDVEFTSYAKEDFTWADQIRTAEWLRGHRGPVVLSNQATPRIVELYRTLGFRIRFLSAPRSISRSGDRASVMEVLATRNLRTANGGGADVRTDGSHDCSGSGEASQVQ
jgi:DNA adenine methylase